MHKATVAHRLNDGMGDSISTRILILPLIEFFNGSLNVDLSSLKICAELCKVCKSDYGMNELKNIFSDQCKIWLKERL